VTGFDISAVPVARLLTAALSRDHEHFRPQQISITNSHLIGLPKSQKAADLAMFAGNVHLPCDAARIPAAQYGLDLPCPCRSSTCKARELACHLHYSQSEASSHVDIVNIRYWHCPHLW
jgi:hypothetical protein